MLCPAQNASVFFLQSPPVPTKPKKLSEKLRDAKQARTREEDATIWMAHKLERENEEQRVQIKQLKEELGKAKDAVAVTKKEIHAKMTKSLEESLALSE